MEWAVVMCGEMALQENLHESGFVWITRGACESACLRRA